MDFSFSGFFFRWDEIYGQHPQLIVHASTTIIILRRWIMHIGGCYATFIWQNIMALDFTIWAAVGVGYLNWYTFRFVGIPYHVAADASQPENFALPSNNWTKELATI
ncbi:hypothetical protein ACJX0J_036621 [Zea mays]